MGPVVAGHPPQARVLPPDYETQPFKYLPPGIVLSDKELELAARYEKGNVSGGYVTSQIAWFRRGPSIEQHQKRREKFRQLKAETDRRGLVLPGAFIELVESFSQWLVNFFAESIAGDPHYEEVLVEYPGM